MIYAELSQFMIDTLPISQKFTLSKCEEFSLAWLENLNENMRVSTPREFMERICNFNLKNVANENENSCDLCNKSANVFLLI